MPDESIMSFADRIRSADSKNPIKEELKTSERVFKRVTDGIYRRPYSALRELISNAYDADATIVEIQTDYPRFDNITVRDNGNGLTEEALSYLIKNIGGSPKRASFGADYGICNKDDFTKSPGGRKLIGKIGIGLFAVSQLTKEFQIITKTEGSDHRTIADVILQTHSEDYPEEEEFKTGEVLIWTVPAKDETYHGTEIILRKLLESTKNELKSSNRWILCSEEGLESVGMSTERIEPPPTFHIGCYTDKPPSGISTVPSLPWEPTDDPIVKFNKLVSAI